jgi:hypothetical protein
MKTAVFSGITPWVIVCQRTKQKVHWLIYGYIVASLEAGTPHKISFALAGSSKASVVHLLAFINMS